MTKHNTKEKEAINLAYNFINWMVERDHRMERTVKQALKEERKERNSIYTAKALIVQCFTEGATKRSYPLSELFVYAEQLQLVTIVGAAWKNRFAEHKQVNDLKERAEEAHKAHNDYIHRALEAIF